MKGRASLRDVAALADVSVRTVSNVVNNFPYVAAATRARVQRALDELDYQPNLAARSLRTGRSNIIALAVPVLDAPYFGELAREIVNAADPHSYTVLVEHTEALASRERRLFFGAASHLIDGLILSPVGLRPDEIRELLDRKPLVLLGEHDLGSVADHVAIDNVAAAHAATTHLLSLGRRRIATIGCTAQPHSAAARLRHRGYVAALGDAGISPDEGLILTPASLDRRGGAEAMESLLSSGRVADAILCYNDLVALGAIRTLLSRGFRVPDDIAVAGIDDIEEGRFSTPTLTTIAPDKRQIAQLAIECLIARMTDRSQVAAPRALEATFELVVRESTSGGAAS
jgi:DNA-binding LacI/PurR family transcriptional regulator